MPIDQHAGKKATKPYTVRDAVYDLMRRFGMTSVFGNPGSTELPMFRDFPSEFRYVLGLQEAIVVGMADGYAQATRNASLVNLHSAAGVGNAMGNIFTAFRNKTPIVLTAGQQARSILPFEPFLASSQAAELPRPYVKWSVEPARAHDVPAAIARAYYLAMMPPRGPVLVSIPADDWDHPAEPVPHRTVGSRLQPEPLMLERIAEAVNASRSPAFVVGAEVDRDGAWESMVRYAERQGAVVWAAPMSGRCSFPEDHPQFAGFLPPMREKIVALLQGHDLIFVIGAPAFTYHIEGSGPHLPQGAILCQVTQDPMTASWTPEGMAAVGSPGLCLEALLAKKPLREHVCTFTRVAPPHVEPGEPLTSAYVFQTIAELRPENSIVVEEAPSARPVMQRYLPITRSEGFYTMDSGGLGYGMPAAIGVSLGKPDQRIIAIIGDGSAMYSPQALWNAAQHNLPITFVILNNGRYAALQDFAPAFGFSNSDPVQGTDLPGIDFTGLAASMGCAGRRVDNAEQLHAALQAAFRSAGPVLLDVKVV